jgi:alginate O-acetyltransferase complex protein AlgI
MLFNSFSFLGLVILTFVIYYFSKSESFQIKTLILSSLVFYSFNQPILVLLLLFSVSINVISSYYVVYGAPRNKKIYAVLGVLLNLLVLIFFKYSPLVAATFFSTGDSIGQFLVTIPLPIGISFFTFQGISLVVDVYKEEYIKNEEMIPRSFSKHAQRILFFKSFFPQLVAGPIVKAHDFIPQIKLKEIKDIHWELCFKNIVLGYFLKMVIADNLKDFTFWIDFPYFQGQSSLTLIIMLFGYSFQIFADFAGYSLIAIGLAKLFGYDLIENFNFPYISSSFSEFWQRWHISLSSFLKEYLYIPLGGNRKGEWRTYLNLMLTMLIGGLWHGAAWSYAVWGGFHGLALVTERILKKYLKIKSNTLTKTAGIIIVFLFVTLAWLLFKLPNFKYVIEYFRSISKNIYLHDNSIVISYIALYSLPVILYHVIYLLKNHLIFAKIKRLEYYFYGCMLFLIITNSGSAGAFIYFQF